MKGIILILLLVVIAGCQKSTTDSYYMQGNPSAGGKVFVSKSCIRCHSINGVGGTEAKDLGQPATQLPTAASVMTAIWNHGPEMRQKVRELNLEYPYLSFEDTVNLLAFLFNASYFNDQGNFEEGKKVVKEKKCLQCHSLEGEGGKGILSWGKYLHPIVWIQKMWNHAPDMAKMMEGKEIEWPLFEGNEMSDLLTYMNATSPVIRDISGIFPADSLKGKKIYQDRKCDACHGQGKPAPDLMEPSEETQSMVSLSAAMWNHAPSMMEMGEQEEIPYPIMERKDIADLVAYIFTTRYFTIQGDVERGKKVFYEKKCSDCHLNSGGPPLEFFKGRCTPSYMITEMWNHGPIMEKKLLTKGYAWPKLTEKEMIDLLTYLNEGS